MKYITETKVVPKELILTKEEFKILKDFERTLIEIWQDDDIEEAFCGSWSGFLETIFEDIEATEEIYTDTFSIDLNDYR